MLKGLFNRRRRETARRLDALERDVKGVSAALDSAVQRLDCRPTPCERVELIHRSSGESIELTPTQVRFIARLADEEESAGFLRKLGRLLG